MKYNFRQHSDGVKKVDQAIKDVEYYRQVRDVCQKKNGKMLEFFPSRGPPLPSPLFGNPMFVRKKIWFILHFRTLGTFLVFTKMFTFWVVLWFVEVGTGDPPPLQAKNSHFIPFC